MNEVLMRMRSRNKPTPPNSQYPHLWVLLEVISNPVSTYAVPGAQYSSGSITIRFAEEGVRIREVVRRSNYRMTGKFPSKKNRRMIHWESHYEKKAFLILEICHLVKSYREQPAELLYSDSDGVQHSHFPDILVELVAGIWLFIEVKPESAINDAHLARRTTLIKELLRPLGYHYMVIVPEQVERLAYLENARHLKLTCRAPIPGPIWEKISQLFRSSDLMPLSSLIHELAHPNARNWVYQLLLTGVVNCDLSLPLTDQSMVGLNRKGEI